MRELGRRRRPCRARARRGTAARPRGRTTCSCPRRASTTRPGSCADRVWIVDPLDGTWEYGQGRADFAVHVALWTRTADGGVLSAATVELPAEGTTYSVLDPVPTPAPVPRDRPVRVVVSRSRRPAGLDDVVARLAGLLGDEGLTEQGVEVLEVGSVGAKAGELFAGRAEVYLHDRGFSDWDLAAPLAVARHRGLWCTSPDGTELVFNRPSLVQPGIVMAVPAVASAVRRALAPALSGTPCRAADCADDHDHTVAPRPRHRWLPRHRCRRLSRVRRPR